MDRVLQNTTATISATFYVDGTATNPSPDSATVTIARADGTVLVASTAATEAGTGRFSYQLTTTHTALLDRLTASWTSNLGTVTTVVEVAGGFLFTLAQARQVAPLNDATKYTTARLEEMRVQVEQSLEDACGVAFVPRYERERINGARVYRSTDILLRWPRVRAVRDATVDGIALTAGQLDDLVVSSSVVYYASGWGWRASSEATVGYEHGYDYPPARVSQAAILLAKRWLIQGPIDDRATSMSNDDGTFVLSTPGMRGSLFGIPEVDATVDMYGFPVVV